MEKEEKKNLIDEYLQNGLDGMEVHLCEEEIDQIIRLALKMERQKEHVGLFSERINHNEREKAFHDQWLKENIETYGVNYGFGILQDLFFQSSGNPMGLMASKCLERINERDRMIVATVIQWLGSNVGMGFLNEALRQFGARIVYNKKY